jgi:hypothetical protein
MAHGVMYSQQAVAVIAFHPLSLVLFCVPVFCELLHISIVLRGWLKDPDKPISELSRFHNETRTHPYSVEEIARMKAFLLEHNWIGYMSLFCRDQSSEQGSECLWPWTQSIDLDSGSVGKN